MKQQIEKIKNHVQENKKVYIVGAGCLVVGAVGGVLCSQGGVQIVDSLKITLINWKSPHVSMTTLVRRGHPGNTIRCIQTGELFASQERAALANSVNSSGLSRHLNGQNLHAGGLTFEKLGETA